MGYEASANGSAGHPGGVWVLVSEAHLWSAGLPSCVTFLHQPNVNNGAALMGLFARREYAEDFVTKAGLSGARALAITDDLLLIAVLTHCLMAKVTDAVQYTPGDSGPVVSVASIDQLVAALSARARPE